MSQAHLEKKVADYLRKSQALEDYWQQPITSEQLQAEMDRMAEHTKQPEMLRELFEALGNDPFVIAECLARPMLAQRILRNLYARDHDRSDSPLNNANWTGHQRQLQVVNYKLPDVVASGIVTKNASATDRPGSAPDCRTPIAIWRY